MQNHSCHQILCYLCHYTVTNSSTTRGKPSTTTQLLSHNQEYDIFYDFVFNVDHCSSNIYKLPLVSWSRKLPTGGLTWQKGILCQYILYSSFQTSYTPINSVPYIRYCSTYPSHDMGGFPLPAALGVSLWYTFFSSLSQPLFSVPSQQISFHQPHQSKPLVHFLICHSIC